MTSAVYNGKWPKLRMLILTRDRYECQLRLPGCKGRANQVDHIVGIAQGGEWWNPNNLRSACKTCNVAKGNLDRQRTPSRQW